MYDSTVRTRALSLLHGGLSLNATSKQLAISRSTIREWRDRPRPTPQDPLPQAPPPITDRQSYAHIFGWYLGDGCISAHPKGVYALRISCDDRYPGLQREVRTAIIHVHPDRRTYSVARIGCREIVGFWKHWPTVFPQHGPGKKHTRRILLENWQREIIEEFPGPFLRGLFHSDGCRITNWTVRSVSGQHKRYEYPRYFFANLCEDILQLCGWALDLAGIAWRRAGTKHISVARREAVARLDEHVGPKY